MTILRDRQAMSTKLSRIAELAKKNKELKFLSIAHLLTVEVRFSHHSGRSFCIIPATHFGAFRPPLWGLSR
jgi:hypothetical protein